MTDAAKDYNRATLPKFKDKVMYTTASGREESYAISSSFKGILRLSPNDSTTVYEEVEGLVIPDFSKIETNYSDAIVFEGAAALENNASIERRMIVASDSDSCAVDLRISNNGVEFKNLNVVGISKFNHVTLYVGDKDKNVTPFKIGNTIMPYLHNEGGDKTRTDGLSYDTKDIDIVNDDIDNSYFLYSDGSGNERSFKYGKAKPFIENLVLEALLDLQTIPTGSIHFVPVNIAQYKALLGIQTGSADNKISNKPNIHTEETDPIVRDFLLCDGRRYNTKDFPELAKILWNESVEYWRKDKKGNNYFLEKQEYKNEFVVVDGENVKSDPSGKTFRVPDLRRMFISSIYANGVSGYEENATMLKEGTEVPEKNVPGHWSPDNLPKGEDGTDSHFHFMTYGTYSPIVSYRSGRNGYKFLKEESNAFSEVARDESGIYEGLVKMDDDAKPAVMTMTNHIVYCNTFDGPGIGVGTGGLRRRDYWGYEPWPAVAYLAGPRTGSNNIKNYNYVEPTIGKTTTSIPAIPYSGNSNATIYNASKDNDELNGEKYVALDENLFGYENSPKFYACLPLIKI